MLSSKHSSLSGILSSTQVGYLNPVIVILNYVIICIGSTTDHSPFNSANRPYVTSLSTQVNSNVGFNTNSLEAGR